MEKQFRFGLNSVVTDKLTGHSGVVSARAQYATDVNSYLVQRLSLQAGSIPSWVPEGRLMLTADVPLPASEN